MQSLLQPFGLFFHHLPAFTFVLFVPNSFNPENTTRVSDRNKASLCVLRRLQRGTRAGKGYGRHELWVNRVRASDASVQETNAHFLLHIRAFQNLAKLLK